MQAIVHERYGAPDRVLRLAEVDRPVPGRDQVLVRVHASSVNAGDWRRVRADPFIVRLSDGLLRPASPIPGGDAAGTVEAVGEDVTDLRPGDEVFGVRTGAYAEYVAGRSFVRKPVNLTFEEAAAMPIAALTALQGIRDHGRLEAGQRVLVTGAGGGVGTFAVQIAAVLGGHVTAASRPANAELLRTLGAEAVIDRDRRAELERSGPFDLIVDVGAGWPLGRLAAALAPGGRLVLIGAGRGRFLALLRRIAAVAIRARLLRQPMTFFIAKVNRADLETLRDLSEAGKLRPVIDRRYPLAQVGAALRYGETELARGKVVITIP